MSEDLDRARYELLRDALLAFVARHPNAAVERFKQGLANWGSDWCGGTAVHHRAAGFLVPALASATKATRDLAELFTEERAGLKWEQTYTVADTAVSEALVNNYGFVELIGKQGPFLSNHVRAGVGVWGPNVHYPAHRHQAEEVYMPLAGSAFFEFDHGPQQLQRAGDVVYVPSLTVHGFRTGDEPFVALYIWQAGDLREKSTFV